jgi:hypothetical protein
MIAITHSVRRIGAAVAFALFAPAVAGAQTTITFDDLGGSNGDVFSSYLESGYLLEAAGGTLQHAFFVGNPTPSLFTFTGGSIRITRSDGGNFFFLGTEFGTGGNQAAERTHTFAGFLAAAQVYIVFGTNVGQFDFYAGPQPLAQIDELLITVGPGQSTSINIDNILFADAVAVPEPGTLAMLGIGLVGLVAVRRRRWTK